jgi:PAS domain S-box-containing protein
LRSADSGIKTNAMDIMDSLPFYVILLDKNHNIIDANEAVNKQLGVNRQEILGKYCPAVIHGLQQPFSGCPLEETVAKNIGIEKELFDDKNNRWVISSTYPTRAHTKEGKRIYLHLVIDVTDRKLAQEQLKASHEQLRHLSAYIESVREAEKKKIARDLHDETSQTLASLHAYLEAAIETLPSGTEKTRDLLKKAQILSTDILDGIHALIYELRPSTLDELGLVAAVNSMLDNFLKVSKLKIHFKTAGRVVRLTPSLEIMLFRVIQEAFNNVIKHAQAKNARLLMQFKKQMVRIEIRDDGVGFDTQETNGINHMPRGFGLLGIKERVELVNGSLDIKSSLGQGTIIIIEVPVNDGDGYGKDKTTVSR